ncbi:DEAD-domain-containing protein [Gigaspora margarita]|uniref:RNA helicase n=1 Tax=Gigaspora margarita TaxID=4874 RepID=A0A8H4EUB2_GIGMA|nr:DEAD-domain-containing protein [Gigaspora margarita]
MSKIKIDRTKDVQIDEDVNFESLIANQNILRGLLEAGYDRPSPIQLKAVPPGKLGLDVIAQAKSGTGKTIVFGVIALEMLNLNNTRPQVLILAPTREIAVQTKEVISNIGRYMNGLICHVFIGGIPVEEDIPKLKKCHIVIGSPGRIGLLLNKQMVAKDIKLFVLDEADKLMENNFIPQLKKINDKLPKTKQVLAFSATYDKVLLKTLENFVCNPYHVMLSEDTPALEGVLQYYQIVKVPNKINITERFKFYEEKFKKMVDLLSHVPFYQCIVFLNHRGRAVDLANYLTNQGWMAMNISGMMADLINEFVLKQCRRLIARGIDIDRVNLVVNLDMPKDAETYLHRVGRTGRYGTHGLAISFVDINELEFIESLKTNYHVDILTLPDEISFKHHQRPLTTENDQEAYESLLNIRETIKTQNPEVPPVIFSDDTDSKIKPTKLKEQKETEEAEETSYYPFYNTYYTDYYNWMYNTYNTDYYNWMYNNYNSDYYNWMYNTVPGDTDENYDNNNDFIPPDLAF